MSIFEYDEEKHLKNERELAYKNGEDAGIEKGIALGREEGLVLGREEGLMLGREEGEKRFSKLLQILMKEGRSDDSSRVITDRSYREKLYREHNL